MTKERHIGRRAAIAAVLTAAVLSCTSIDCPVQNTVYTVYNVWGTEGADTLHDTLYIWTRRSDDSLLMLYNRGVDLTTFNLPISYQQPADTLVFYASRMDVTDTVWIEKEDIPHFESVDCSAAFFHRITAARCTHRGIDSIVIHHSYVDYDPTTAHFHIYFKARD